MDQAFLALHDLSLDVSGSITPVRIAEWAQKAMRTLNPTLQTAVWWLKDESAHVLRGNPPQELRILPDRNPRHLCLMHHQELIDASFFGVSSDQDWFFIPITDRKVLFGWIGIETAADAIAGLLPVLCTMGAMLGQFVRRQQTEDERVAAERTHAILSRYLSPEMAKEITHGDFRDRFVENASVLILDIRGFTERIFAQEPRSLLNELNGFFEESVQCIFEQAGIVDKLLGDGLLAHFGVLPNEPPAPAQRAVDAALLLIEKTRRFNEMKRPCTPFTVGIGIATGSLHVGNVGGKDFFDLTVIGQPVNLAARLQSETKTLGCNIVMDGRTHAAIRYAEGWACHPGRIIRGLPEPIDVYGR